MNISFLPPAVAVLVLQLVFSSTATSYVGLRRAIRQGFSARTWGAILWGAAYWFKSALIAIAIIYGPERNHWTILYAALAGITFAIGDIGLLLLWTRLRAQDVGVVPPLEGK
jgi:predicted lysophospholipase L1 biosynthesis ABC-type transport system permease subunit